MKSRAIQLLYSLYFLFDKVKPAGVWCWPTNAIFNAVFEGIVVQYQKYTVNSFYSTRLKRPGCGAEQPMLYLMQSLKEE
jgi:hypothetical protein